MTPEWFFSGVRALVRLKRAVLCEALRAELASVRPLSGVLVHVRLEISVLRERLGAQLALVWFIVAVNQQVPLQVAIPYEGSRTFVALEGLFAC